MSLASCDQNDVGLFVNLLHSGIEVSLQESSYTVLEGLAIVICADFEMGISDIAVVLSIGSTQDTAQGQY